MSRTETMRDFTTEDISGVEIGASIHEHSYKRKRREIGLDGIKLDFIEPGRGLIHEVKKSKAVEDAHIWQLKYYLYRLKYVGVSFTGKSPHPPVLWLKMRYHPQKANTQ